MYEAQGLRVEMLRSTGGGNAATLVAAGNDQVGVAGAADVLIARGKGLDITAFALLRALLASNNLSENDVKIVLIGAGDLVSSVMGQRVDAIAAFETTNV